MSRSLLTWLVVASSCVGGAHRAQASELGSAAARALRYAEKHGVCGWDVFVRPWTKQPQWKKKGSYFTVLTPFAQVCWSIRSSMRSSEKMTQEVAESVTNQALARRTVYVIARFPTIAEKGEGPTRWWRHDEYQGYIRVSDGKKYFDLAPVRSTAKQDLDFKETGGGSHWRDFATREFSFTLPNVKLPKRVRLIFEVRKPTSTPGNGMWARFVFPRGEFLK